MNLQVTFKQQNPDFNKEYAKEYHGGKESDGNRKDLWFETFKLPFPIDKIAIIEKGKLEINGEIEAKGPATIIIPNMTILECYVADLVKVKFAVSKELILKTHKAYNEKYDISRYYFYFKPRTDYFQLSDSIYVIEKDIPQILKKN